MWPGRWWAGLCSFRWALGVANVWFYLPISTAVAHNACAAMLVLALITLGHGLRSARNQPETP